MWILEEQTANCVHINLYYAKSFGQFSSLYSFPCNLEIKEPIFSSGPQTFGRVHQHWPLSSDVCYRQWTNCHRGGVSLKQELQEYHLLDLCCDQGDQANYSPSSVPVLPIGPSQDFIKTKRYYLRLN